MNKEVIKKPAWKILAVLGAVMVFAFLVFVRSSTFSGDYDIGSFDDQSAKIIFTAAGDYGASVETDKVLSLIPLQKSNFHIALGDFSYGVLETEKDWCKYVRSYVGEDFPFELIAGNHESNGLDGHIDEFAKCLPNLIPEINGAYGKEYYFDYPAIKPIARLILISPALDFEHVKNYSYVSGTAQFNWLDDAISSARKSGIKWTVVAMHRECLFPGRSDCLASSSLINYLINQKVDLILQANAHIYTRSKQLKCLIASERGILYDENCVVDNKLGNILKKDAGSVIIVAATGGRDLRESSENGDAYKYLEKIMSKNVRPTHGILKVTISESELRGQFIPTDLNGFSDTFIIR